MTIVMRISMPSVCASSTSVGSSGLPWVAAAALSQRRDATLEFLQAAFAEPLLDDEEPIAMISSLSVAWPVASRR